MALTRARPQSRLVPPTHWHLLVPKSPCLTCTRWSLNRTAEDKAQGPVPKWVRDHDCGHSLESHQHALARRSVMIASVLDLERNQGHKEMAVGYWKKKMPLVASAVFDVLFYLFAACATWRMPSTRQALIQACKFNLTRHQQ
ncbi:hypothetical protein OG21DRAFT_1507880 [Imleria badia]|nr:hypothetical protein OG21DRAFT_1507880 [Imleria badia]